MSGWTSWLPVAASDTATRIDALFYTLVAITGVVAVGVTAVALYFALRYRAGSDADRTDPPTSLRALELGWIFTPLAIFIGIFIWGATVYAGLYRREGNEMTVFVVGKQWMWKVQHTDGRREIDVVHLPLGQPVRLIISTEDVIHSFFIPAFRIKQDAVPGRYTTIRFTPTREGEYWLHCAEYCGTDHARMGGKVIVMSPPAYARWLETGNERHDLAAQGFDVFRRAGCSGCHQMDESTPPSSVHAPDLRGVFGRTVHLSDGRTVVADEAYLRDSILLPKRDVVAGYQPIMPSFQGQLDEADLAALIAFLKARK